MVRDGAQRFGDDEAVVDGDRRVTLAELSDLVSGAARALVASGIEPGDHVAVWAPNSLDWIVAALAVTTSGGVLVPVNTRFRGGEAAYVLGRRPAPALFTVRGFLGTDYPAPPTLSFPFLAQRAGALGGSRGGAPLVPVAVLGGGVALGRGGREGLPVLPGAPPIPPALPAHPARPRHDISTLRLAVTGAADI